MGGRGECYLWQTALLQLAPLRHADQIENGRIIGLERTGLQWKRTNE